MSRPEDLAAWRLFCWNWLLLAVMTATLLALLALTGFSIEAIARVAERIPQIPRGIITSTWNEVENRPDGPEGLIKETGSTRLHSGVQGLTAEAVERLHDNGYQIHGWPTRTKDDLQRCLDLGLDGTTSDDPRTLKQWLAELAG